MAKLDINLDDSEENTDTYTKLKKLSAPLPSVSKAKAYAWRDTPRVQLAFSNVPSPIKEAFMVEAQKRGITMKEMLYECFRAAGISIPSNDAIDARRR